MALAELRRGSFTSKRNGFAVWWEATGRPPFVLVTDPPYTRVVSTVSSRARKVPRGKVAVIERPIAYGALTNTARQGIAGVAACAEWAAIWDRPEGMGQWKHAIETVAGVWLGTGLVLQTRGAPRMRGDGPGVRHLAIALARRRGKARWRGKSWAEWAETRPAAAGRRPIPGTRSLQVIREILADFAASCSVRPIVVDLCAGTGVVLVAARELGLDSIGWERDVNTHAWAKDVLDGRGETMPEQPQLW